MWPFGRKKTDKGKPRERSNPDAVRVVRFDKHGNPTHWEERHPAQEVQRTRTDVINSLGAFIRFFQHELPALEGEMKKIYRTHLPHLIREEEGVIRTLQQIVQTLETGIQGKDGKKIKDALSTILNKLPALEQQVGRRVKTIKGKLYQEEQRVRDMKTHEENIVKYYQQHALQQPPELTHLRHTLEMLEKLLRDYGAAFWKETEEEYARAEHLIHETRKLPLGEVQYPENSIRTLLHNVRLLLQEHEHTLQHAKEIEKNLHDKAVLLKNQTKSVVEKLSALQAVFRREMQRSA